jgi:acyl dehydratase
MMVGDVIPDWTVESVPAEKMKTMALLLRDPNPIHWDIDAVRRLGMGDKVINQGPTNQAYVINMLLSWLGDPARLKSIRVRFVATVLAGDRVIAGGRVTTLRSDGGVQVADCEVWLDRDDGSRLMGGTAVVAV